ncbi:helix-turn-helix transcriptional regulator [Jeotgalicoccus sp. FSL K6-3177]|uniref:helix-turn-helix transcriptional regulator n=1 Tax=Jeotgalicoccus sp. FSL K6-3177 TaxID=2921494 RepID=UPI0030FDD11D
MIYPILYITRKKPKESATELAKYLHITRQAYAKKENGETQFTLKEAKQLAERYDTSIDYLFKESME